MQVEDEWMHYVFPQYDLSIFRVEPLDSQTVRLDTDKGLKVLNWDSDRQCVQITFEILEGIAKQGYRRIPRMIRTLYGEPFIEVHQLTYWMHDEWSGKPLSYDRSDIEAASGNLAELHQALNQVRIPSYLKIENRQGKWLDRFRDCKNEWEQATRSWSRLDDPNDFQIMMIKKGPALIEEANESIEVLVRSGYDSSRAVQPSSSSLCLSEYKIDDLLMTSDQEVALTRFHTVCFDTPLYDLARFCYHLKTVGYTDELPNVLRKYDDFRKLSDTDLAWIRAYLSFPHAVHWVYQNYRRMRKTPSEFAQRLSQLVDRQATWRSEIASQTHHGAWW